MGCGVAMEGSDFTGPKLETMEVMDEETWAATDVAGATTITITLVSYVQWPNTQCFTNLDQIYAYSQTDIRC